ncbi:hypothetical protein KR222_010915, partial [Zaprionus bogoriensis]
DVRAHFRGSLETTEYENTSNLFQVSTAEQTQQLLQRCELLLAGYADEQAAAATTTAATTTAATATAATVAQVPMTVIKSNGCSEAGAAETGCYLEMLSSKSSSRNSLSASREYIDLSSNPSLHSDKTFRCSGQADKSEKPLPQTQPEPEQQLYDICQQREGEDETQQVFAHELFLHCPYEDLPAGHLALQRSTKYGQLQRIEKRLFFDQSKKYYCGILNDWMLCYADGPTACRPSSSLYLKSSAIEIEHFGEGKRRDICFQITTADPGKRFVYQANNEVDAKEWIHAIEAAIRGDAQAQATLKMLRKLPTPPLAKKSLSIGGNNNNNSYAPAPQTDSIYEEPSPIYNYGEAAAASSATPPRLPDKCNSPGALAKRFEYDIPKCPPQPLLAEDEANAGEVETAELLLNNGEAQLKPLPQPSSLHGSLALDFQAKVKTVHSELSSQLSSPERLKKAAVKKSYSCGNSEPELLALTNSTLSPSATPLAHAKEQQKKQRKASTTTPSKDCDKLARNWFLSRLNKSSSPRSQSSNGSGSGGVGIGMGNATTATPPNAKCKLSEKENLLNGSADHCDGANEQQQQQQQQALTPSSNPTSPCLKAEAKSKVNMIINQFENSGHLFMFSVETLADNAIASLTSFCERDSDSNCNNYEPIVPLSPPPSSFLKKV